MVPVAGVTVAVPKPSTPDLSAIVNNPFFHTSDHNATTLPNDVVREAISGNRKGLSEVCDIHSMTVDEIALQLSRKTVQSAIHLSSTPQTEVAMSGKGGTETGYVPCLGTAVTSYDTVTGYTSSTPVCV